jgi:predicted dehydrogenase
VLDQTWYLMGCPKPVSITGSVYQKFKHSVPKGVRYTVDDAAFGLIRFANDATLLLEATWAWHLPTSRTGRLAGTKGGVDLDPLTFYTDDDGVPVNITPQARELVFQPPAGPTNFPGETAHFVDCCLNRKKCICSAEHGVQLMQMLDGIYQSAKTGREVRLR